MELIINIYRLIKLFIICVIAFLFHGKGWKLRAITMMGPAFIKIGQFLSARPDIVGSELASELGKLRDQLNGFSFKYAEKILRNDFGNSKIFRHIEQQPISAASIAQVHKAIDYDGTVLAVKIVRPGIERDIMSNLKLFHWIVNVAMFFNKSLKTTGANLITVHMMEMIRDEVDMRMEAAHMLEFIEMNDDTVRIPRVLFDKTSVNVLTAEWVASSAHIINQEVIMDKVLRHFLRSALVCGVFHADMHMGNILCLESDEVALVDFGKVGYLTLDERYYILEVLRGFCGRDYQRVARVHGDLGYIDKVSPQFVNACRAIGELFFGKSMSQISATKLMKGMFEIAARFGMATKPNLMLFHKNLIMIEGAFGEKTNVNLWKLLREWLNGDDIVHNRLLARQYILVSRKAAQIGRLINSLDDLRKRKPSKIGLALALNSLITILMCLCVMYRYL